METIALAEAEGWPDLLEGQKAIELQQRKLLEACKAAGLARHAQLVKARSIYPEANFVEFVCKLRCISGEEHVKENSVTIRRDGDDPSMLRLGYEVSGIRGNWAYVGGVERFNGSIPRAVLLKLADVKREDLFNRFAIAAHWRHWTCSRSTHNDPLLLGVIDAFTNNPEHAVYFLLAEWE